MVLGSDHARHADTFARRGAATQKGGGSSSTSPDMWLAMSSSSLGVASAHMPSRDRSGKWSAQSASIGPAGSSRVPGAGIVGRRTPATHCGSASSWLHPSITGLQSCALELDSSSTRRGGMDHRDAIGLAAAEMPGGAAILADIGGLGRWSAASRIDSGCPSRSR